METGTTEELFSQEPYALTCLLTPSSVQEDKNSSTETACLAVPTLYCYFRASFLTACAKHRRPEIQKLNLLCLQQFAITLVLSDMIYQYQLPS